MASNAGRQKADLWAHLLSWVRKLSKHKRTSSAIVMVAVIATLAGLFGISGVWILTATLLMGVATSIYPSNKQIRHRRLSGCLSIALGLLAFGVVGANRYIFPQPKKLSSGPAPCESHRVLTYDVESVDSTTVPLFASDQVLRTSSALGATTLTPISTDQYKLTFVNVSCGPIQIEVIKPRVISGNRSDLSGTFYANVGGGDITEDASLYVNLDESSPTLRIRSSGKPFSADTIRLAPNNPFTIQVSVTGTHYYYVYRYDAIVIGSKGERSTVQIMNTKNSGKPFDITGRVAVERYGVAWVNATDPSSGGMITRQMTYDERLKADKDQYPEG